MFKVSVNTIHEEGECPECGWPIYVGDYGYWSDFTERLYCCKPHAEQAEREEAEKQAAYYGACQEAV